LPPQPARSSHLEAFIVGVVFRRGSRSGFEQGPNGCLQMQFIDIYSCYHHDGEGVKATSCQRPLNYRRAELSTSIYGDRGGVVFLAKGGAL
jgi:hypothetical protein